MKKLFLVLLSIVLLVIGAAYAVLRFWPDTRVGEYTAFGVERAEAWYAVGQAKALEGWRNLVAYGKARFGAKQEEAPTPAPAAAAPAPAAEEPEVAEAVPAAEPPPPPAKSEPKAEEGPWKGLSAANRYTGAQLSEKSLDGKIVMVYMFSVEDEDSLALLPRLEQVWSAYRSKPFVLLGSHRGGRSPRVASALKRAKVTFPVYEDAGRTKEPGSGGQYPAIYVVDDRGRMIYRGRSDLEATEAVVTAIPDVRRRK